MGISGIGIALLRDRREAAEPVHHAEKDQLGIVRRIRKPAPGQPVPLVQLGGEAVQHEQLRLRALQRRQPIGVGPDMVRAVEPGPGKGDGGGAATHDRPF